MGLISEDLIFIADIILLPLNEIIYSVLAESLLRVQAKVLFIMS